MMLLLLMSLRYYMLLIYAIQMHVAIIADTLRCCHAMLDMLPRAAISLILRYAFATMLLQRRFSDYASSFSSSSLFFSRRLHYACFSFSFMLMIITLFAIR